MGAGVRRTGRPDPGHALLEALAVPRRGREEVGDPVPPEPGPHQLRGHRVGRQDGAVAGETVAQPVLLAGMGAYARVQQLQAREGLGER